MLSRECDLLKTHCARNYELAAQISIDPMVANRDLANDVIQPLLTKSGARLDVKFTDGEIDAKLFCGICTTVVKLVPFSQTQEG